MQKEHWKTLEGAGFTPEQVSLIASLTSSAICEAEARMFRWSCMISLSVAGLMLMAAWVSS